MTILAMHKLVQVGVDNEPLSLEHIRGSRRTLG